MNREITALIIEDERLSSDRLKQLIASCDPSIKVVGVADSVISGRDWFRANTLPDLLFLDIQLSDGTDFDLLSEVEPKCPIIFTTAYDEYAVKAFRYNSLDYLLKPIVPEELQRSLTKYRELNGMRVHGELPDSVQVKNLQRMLTSDFKRRFLVKLGEQFQTVDISQVAYFLYDDGITYLFTNEGRKWPLDQSLDQLEGVIDPLQFYRVNRKLIVSVKAIAEIHSYFNSRLQLQLSPVLKEDVVVSRDRVPDFKRWMDL